MTDFNTVTFNIDKLNNIINKAKRSFDGGDDKTNIAYLPPGNHEIRFFHDPNDELFRSFSSHRVGKYVTMCPDWLKENRVDGSSELPDCDICEISNQIASNTDDWRLPPSRRYGVMVYGHLYNTDSPSKYWEIGKDYVIIGKSKLERSMLSLLKNMAKGDPSFALSTLTPQLSGLVLGVEVAGGTQGYVNLTPQLGLTQGPIKLGGWWKPLSEVYIPSEFNIETYKLTVVEAKKLLNDVLGLSHDNNDSTTSNLNRLTGPDSNSSPPVDLNIFNKPAESTTPAPTPVPPHTLPESVASSPEPIPTTSQAPSQSSSGLPANQRLVNGQVITLTPYIVENNCWGKYDSAIPQCVGCSLNILCLGSSMNR